MSDSSGPENEPPDDLPPDDLPPQNGAGGSDPLLTPPKFGMAAVMFYALLTGAGLVWLSLRDRLEALPPLAIGEHGPAVSLISGAAVGWLLGIAVALSVRYLPPFRELDARLRGMMGSPTEPQMLAIAISSGVGEEVFFRCALQDYVGVWFAALIFAGLHTGPGLLLWGAYALVVGLAFGWMVEAGLGLLSVSVAHALVNYISLRRMAYA